MTARYHVNAAGNPGKCSAEAGNCPFGAEDAHYTTRREAARAYEAAYPPLPLPQRLRALRRGFLTVGSVSMLAVSLTGCISIGLGAPAPYSQNPDPAPKEAKPLITEEEKQQLGEAAEGLGGKLKEMVDGLSSGQEATPPQPTGDVYFQGRPLQPPQEEVQRAQALLDALVEQPAGSGEGYNRAEMYGKGFETGLAGRLEHRDVPNSTFRNDTPQARVVSGSFVDPYTGLPVQVTGGDSADADIDHITPLKEAYRSETRPLSPQERKQLANDFDNLQYTASSVNRSKSDQDASTWLPSYEPAQCTYVIAQIAVKDRYDLSVDSAEKQAMQNVLDTRCTEGAS